MTAQLAGVLDMPAEDYHAHPALSSTGARRILQAPALYRWETDHPTESTPTFDFGRAAHRHVLGAGDPVEVLDFPDWRSKPAQAAKAEAIAAGRTPLLVKDWQTVEDMAAALRRASLALPDGARLPIASLFDGGEPERSLFWTDPETGVPSRARLDYLPDRVKGRRLVIPDYKTARTADPREFGRAADQYGYHVQAAWYLDGVRAVGLDPDPAFVFVVQEKTPPYLVSVVQLDHEDMRLGRMLADRARRIYAECVATGEWPGYGDTVHHVSLPLWAHTREIEEIPA